jgi:parallel beta-helix repeat protein
MRSVAALALTTVLLVPHVATAAVSCPDRTAAVITTPTAASVKCQQTIAKSALGFAKSKLKAMAKCASKQIPGSCPGAKETDKIVKAATKAAAKITAECGSDSVQGGLTSSYASLTDDTVISSCMLSQHSATADIVVGDIAGTPGQVRTGEARDKCVKTLNKTGVKQATGAHKIINKCLASQMALGTGGNLADVCVGHWAGGAFVAPMDAKTAEKLAALSTKTEEAVGKDCTAVTASLIRSIYACAGATTVADLKACIVCKAWDGVLDFVDQENSETGDYIANGPGALQAAVTAASAGDKLLIAPGDYAEAVTIATANLQLVGCGAATGNRPRVLPPGIGGPYPNGISAGSVDGLHFQSLDLYGWDENGIFVSSAQGVSFRDVHADGNLTSTYGIFPILSDNVVVETSSAVNVRDAGIYVGQSTNIVARYNRAEDNVAGLEIENSSTASVHNNYLTNNSGGLLVFKLPGLPTQISDNHKVFANVSVNNNTPNFGIPGSTVSLVPTGTGLLIISNDDGEFYGNIVQGNDSFGIALVDQQAVNFLVGGDPPPFDPTSHTCDGGTNDGDVCNPDNVDPCPGGGTCVENQKAENNKIHDNLVGGNGSNPASPVGGDVLMAIVESDLPHGNCMTANAIPPVFVAGANDCP